MIGTINTTVAAIHAARTRRQIAKVVQRRQKAVARQPVAPLTHEQRIHRYANQSGWTSAFTPKQRRRLDHKDNRAQGYYNPYITKVDGTKAFAASTEEVA
jgi:hypothetical protein